MNPRHEVINFSLSSFHSSGLKVQYCYSDPMKRAIYSFNLTLVSTSWTRLLMVSGYAIYPTIYLGFTSLSASLKAYYSKGSVISKNTVQSSKWRLSFIYFLHY